MTAPHYADLAAKLLRSHGAEAEPPAPSASSREDAIGALQGAIAAKAQADVRKRRAKLAVGGLAAAAALALVVSGVSHMWPSRAPPSAVAVAMASPKVQVPSHALQGDLPGITVVAHPSGGGAAVVSSSGALPAALGDGSELGPGSRVIADPSGRALLSLSTGTTMMVEEGGDLTVAPRGSEQRFNLTSGKVHANVAKLHDGQRFFIQTTDAEVEVRGTSFDVAVVDPESCGGGTHTRVMVSEGVVVVRHDGKEDRVAAGEQWPRDCAARPEPKKPLGPSRESASPKLGPVAAPTNAPARTTSTSSSLPTSALAAQNDLFERGVAERRRGNGAAAVDTFDRFLASYPESPLAENAVVERMRALHLVDPARSREAAKKYLAAYRAGFARSEAGALVAEGP